MIGLGYGIRLLETLQLGVDVEWINFSQFEQLPLDIGSNNALLPARTIPEQWNDSWTCGFGLDWQFLPGWVVRGGYVFLQSPVPDDTLAPTLPDTDTHVMTLGLGYRHGRHAVDLGYALNFYEDRTITDSYNPAYNGKYETSSQLISVSYGISF
jgi:long-chain fatty acid transport protein